MAGELILVVDDDRLIRDAVGYALERQGYRVATASTGEEALLAAAREEPALAVLDISLPGMDGLEVCKALQRQQPIPVIFLTARDAEVERIVGLELGADDYITKPFSLNELVARIKAVLRRARRGSPRGPEPRLLTVGDLALDRAQHTVTVRGQAIALPPREFTLLATLMEQAGHVIERNRLLDLVWGPNFIGDPKTLDVHIRWLREKIERDPTHPRYIRTVRGIGYMMVPEDAP
jgi:DNA-binding response OmpR family regulator